MSITASFLGGPVAGQSRELEKESPFYYIVGTTLSHEFSGDNDSQFLTLVHHAYELETLRLVDGNETHLFYTYIGCRDL